MYATCLQAEPLVATAYRDTALHQAVSQGLVQLLPGILKDAPAGVLDGLTDSQQNNALHAAALAGDSSPAVQVLLLLLRSGMALECPGAIPQCKHLQGKELGSDMLSYL